MAEAPVLAHSVISPKDRPAARHAVFLHGVFGMGSNLRTLAKDLASELPDLALHLVDLRGHGRSEGFEPPHTVARAAEDVVRLLDVLGIEPAVLVGHSFGGKVAVTAAEQLASAVRLCVLDASPSARAEPGAEAIPEGDVASVLALLEGIEAPLPSREAFVERVSAAGHSPAVAAWLAMSLRPPKRPSDGYTLRYDLGAIRAMLEDYFRLDLWPAVERLSATRPVAFVVGGRSTVVTVEDRARLASIAQTVPTLTLEVLPEAGHMLHVDDPAGLAAAVGRFCRKG